MFSPAILIRMKIKTGDTVKVLLGRKEVKGKSAKVIQVLTNKKNGLVYVVLEGLNMRKKHLRTRDPKQKGQAIELPGPIHISNVMLLDPKTKEASRVGYVMNGDKKVRVVKKTGEQLR